MPTLAINRRFLYVGLFLVALGGVLVAVDLSAVDSASLGAALRLWPLAFVAIGAAIVLRRSRFALVAGILAAMVPGLVLGGGLALVPRYAPDCGAGVEQLPAATQRGTFAGTANVELEASCGSVSIGTQAGNSWALTTTNTAGLAPIVSESDQVLQVISHGDDDWGFDSGRDAWTLALPTTRLERVALDVNAGRASVALPGADIGTLKLRGNAADITVDASSTAMSELDGALNFGRMSIQLPEHSSLSGAIRVGAGMLELCAQPGSLLHVDFAGTPREVRVNGLQTDASEWQSDNALSPYRIDLSVKVNFGTVAINPIGGCK
jgi:hypothetical protein